jgi:hypothetical protein
LLALAPDGRPEVYFFVVFKPGVPVRSLQELSKQVSDLRKRRLEIQQAPPGDTAGGAANRQEELRAAWHQMRAADKYGTIVVGANEGREPFVASFGGLPPYVFLLEDAVEKAEAKLGGPPPQAPRLVWLPPLFVLFEFIQDKGQLSRSMFIEARGTEIVEVSLSGWRRQSMPPDALRRREAKWAAFRERSRGSH